MIKTIIFDLGNVIVNVDRTNLFKELTINSNKNTAYIKDYYENSSVGRLFERGKLKPKEFYARVANELSLKMPFAHFKEIYCDIFTLNKDVANLIQKLKKKNFRLILLSNTDVLHYEYIKNKYKIIDIFDDYVLSYKTGCRKPNPMIFLEALKKAKTLPFNCLYFDDIPEFVYAARLMGIRAFQFKNYAKLVEDLKKSDII